MSNLFGNSALTLRRQSPTCWSFSKEQRFKSPKARLESDYMTPQSTLNPRATSIGYGKRWKPHNPCGKDSPPPGTYNIPTIFNKEMGPKIIRTTALPIVSSGHSTPGPGTYESYSAIGKHGPRFSFGGRELTIKISENPPPNAYNPVTTLTEFSGYKGVGFGYGGRLFPSISQDTPGPGAYNHVSVFNKMKKLY